MFVEKLLDFHNINVKNVSDKSYSEERFSTNNILVTWALQMFMLFIIHLEDFYSFFFFSLLLAKMPGEQKWPLLVCWICWLPMQSCWYSTRKSTTEYSGGQNIVAKYQGPKYCEGKFI